LHIRGPRRSRSVPFKRAVPRWRRIRAVGSTRRLGTSECAYTRRAATRPSKSSTCAGEGSVVSFWPPKRFPIRYGEDSPIRFFLEAPGRARPTKSCGRGGRKRPEGGRVSKVVRGSRRRRKRTWGVVGRWWCSRPWWKESYLTTGECRGLGQVSWDRPERG
jgi:hypothetical protein